MNYVIALVAGIACSVVLPRNRRSAYGLLAAGVAFLLAVSVLAFVFGYDMQATIDLLMLEPSPAADTWGLIQLTVVGYTCLIGSIAVGIRCLLARTRNTSESGSNGQ